MSPTRLNLNGKPEITFIATGILNHNQLANHWNATAISYAKGHSQKKREKMEAEVTTRVVSHNADFLTHFHIEQCK